MSIKNGKLIYHLTPLYSLESIIKYGLLSRDDLCKNDIGFIDTADQEILNERKRLGLSQFIPFHFHIHTAYDTVVKNVNSGKIFIYICLHRDFAKENGFMILPIHPASNEQPELFNYIEGFNIIDWDTMELSIPEVIDRDIDLRYHKQVRMAECLSPIPIPVGCFQSINVPDETVKKTVVDLLEVYGIKDRPYINIMNWFV